MMKKLSFPLALLAAATFAAAPLQAQHGHGNGKGHDDDHGRGRQGQLRRERDDDRREDRRDDREEARRREWRRTHTSQGSSTWRGSRNTTLNRRVPPGWCIGRGNPHNTVANCGRGSNRYDRRYDPRYNRTSGTRTVRTSGTRNSTVGGYGSFSEWKRAHDRECRARASQRPMDMRWQLEVHNQCAAEERSARQSFGV